MNNTSDYYPIARAHEEVFRAMLRDLRTNREKRPMGACIPEDLETEAGLDEIFQVYSE